MLRETTLEKKLHDQEMEANKKALVKDEKLRHVKLLEVRIDVKESPRQRPLNPQLMMMINNRKTDLDSNPR